MNDIEKNKVAVVTGSSRGIGLACAIFLAKSGFNIILHGRKNDKSFSNLQRAKEQIEILGKRCLIFQENLESASFADNLVDFTIKNTGRIDCLVNNAGVAALKRGDLLDVTRESYDYCLDINAKSLFFTTQKISKFMLSCIKDSKIENYTPTIINITSCSATILSPSRGEYCVSKAAASMITQLFALRLADTGIKVFEIRPGIIKTDMTSVVEEKYSSLINDGLVPAKRWGFPEDIAKCVCNIAKGNMPFTIGQIINVDGGLNIRCF